MTPRACVSGGSGRQQRGSAPKNAAYVRLDLHLLCVSVGHLYLVWVELGKPEDKGQIDGQAIHTEDAAGCSKKKRRNLWLSVVIKLHLPASLAYYPCRLELLEVEVQPLSEEAHLVLRTQQSYILIWTKELIQAIFGTISTALMRSNATLLFNVCFFLFLIAFITFCVIFFCKLF